MFSEIDADIYIVADGDDTYDVRRAPSLVQRLLDANLDMVVAARLDVTPNGAPYPLGHRIGNRRICLGGERANRARQVMWASPKKSGTCLRRTKNFFRRTGNWLRGSQDWLWRTQNWLPATAS